MLPDLAGLVSALNAGGVEFVVIGGVAVGAHGHIRATEDLDIVPDPGRDNLDRLGNVLVGLDARLASDPGRGINPEVRRSLYQGRNLTVTTRLGDLDVLQRLPGVPAWNELARDAEETSLADQPVSVSSRAHLIEMKRARAFRTRLTSKRSRTARSAAFARVLVDGGCQPSPRGEGARGQRSTRQA